ncbi:Flavocytochrome c [Annulohypoxylon maeteangense]|uniref:Flavocytochrome c n=1 Tax=Annulohypoxylon maeteangense TaxID=1927788 RepID=UPI002007359E|nr:Flavocytochrome c [Annulohypoxylon maeteangense]KAI0879944.1 Flavocytochrome c [Annulohypoxylon maeteangense]
MVLFRPNATSLTLNSISSSLLATMTTQATAAARKPVIVVGSGLAGLSAAHEALRAGATIRMLDRAPKPGGNSIKASSGINGAGTRFQQPLGITKDDSFFSDTVRSAGARFAERNPPVDRKVLVEILTGQSESAVNWLADELNVDLSVVAQLGGHSVPRTHRGGGKLPPGAAIVSALLDTLKANSSFSLENSAEVDKLLTSDGVVKGVRYRSADGQTYELEGPVVFATGGFAGDAHGLLSKYRPDLAGIPSTNEARPASHGLLSAIGASFVDMDSVQIHPTGFVDPKDPGSAYKFLAAEALRGEGGILLSGDGTRFIDELQTRDVVSAAIMALPHLIVDKTRQWEVKLLLDPGACEATASHIGFYLWKGLLQKIKVRDLAPEVIASVDKYATLVAAHGEDTLGRKAFGHWKLPPGEANRDEEVCVGTVTPVVHFTMGGVTFDSQARVLRTKEGELVPIPGLWAAGEITGGIHGANRLGGSSLLECAVFGRIAGREAAKSLTNV